MVLGLLAGAFCACSEKVETEDKKAVVEEEVKKDEVKEIDPVEAMVRDKLHSIILPRLDFEDVSVEDALTYVTMRIAELDQAEPIEMRGMGMVIRRATMKTANDSLGEGSNGKRIPELRVQNVSVAAALRYICLLTDMRCELDFKLTFSPRDPKSPWNSFGSVLEEKGDTQYIASKFRHLTVPRVDFENTSIYAAIDFLRLRSAELDVTTIDPGRKGINFVVHVPKGMEIPVVEELSMKNASFEDVVKEVCAKTGMRYELDPYSVILVPKDLK